MEFQLVTPNGRGAALIKYMASLPCYVGYGAEIYPDLLHFAVKEYSEWQVSNVADDTLKAALTSL